MFLIIRNKNHNFQICLDNISTSHTRDNAKLRTNRSLQNALHRNLRSIYYVVIITTYVLCKRPILS